MNLITLRKAKEAENNSQWFEAAQLWRSIGHNDDYNACMLIFNATSEGDKFRARVKNECGAEPDKSENPRAWVKWYDDMAAIYNEMFRK